MQPPADWPPMPLNSLLAVAAMILSHLEQVRTKHETKKSRQLRRLYFGRCSVGHVYDKPRLIQPTTSAADVQSATGNWPAVQGTRQDYNQGFFGRTLGSGLKSEHGIAVIITWPFGCGLPLFSQWSPRRRQGRGRGWATNEKIQEVNRQRRKPSGGKCLMQSWLRG